MADRIDPLFWLALGGVAAYWFVSRQSDAAIIDGPVEPYAPAPRARDGVRLIGTDPVEPEPEPAPRVTPDASPAPGAPTYVTARACVFATTEAHAVYSTLDAGFPASFLAAGATVTVAEKRLANGEQWFLARVNPDDLTPAPSGSLAGRPLWFRPNATERGRCA